MLHSLPSHPPILSHHRFPHPFSSPPSPPTPFFSPPTTSQTLPQDQTLFPSTHDQSTSPLPTEAGPIWTIFLISFHLCPSPIPLYQPHVCRFLARDCAIRRCCVEVGVVGMVEMVLSAVFAGFWRSAVRSLLCDNAAQSPRDFQQISHLVSPMLTKPSLPVVCVILRPWFIIIARWFWLHVWNYGGGGVLLLTPSAWFDGDGGGGLWDGWRLKTGHYSGYLPLHTLA